MGLFSSVVTKVFGTRSERELKSIRPIVAKIESLEGQYKSMTDAELRGQTERFRGRLAAGETLDDILPEAFAAVPRGRRPRAGHAPLSACSSSAASCCTRAASPR